MAVKPSGGRASILGAQIVNDTYGTLVALTAATAGTMLVPDNNIGAIVFSPNINFRMRMNAPASTALTWPTSGYYRADTEYGFALNSGVDSIGFISLVPSTVQISWIIGAGA